MDELVEDLPRLVILQRAVKAVVPAVQEHQKIDDAQGEAHDASQKEKGPALFFRLPITFGQAPNVFEKLFGKAEFLLQGPASLSPPARLF